MLDLMVKTLDSQNHSFTLSDEATVLNLKESIYEKMGVPVMSQRLIFHGKVLQDQKKLTECGDVNGKVIHLVQRAPPSSSRPADGSTSRRTEAGVGGGGRRMRRDGNTTYLGSLAFPTIPLLTSDLSNYGVDPARTRPSQMMAHNRLDCARRMLYFARHAIRQMEDPNAPPPQPAMWARQPRRPPPGTRTSTGTSTTPTTEDRGTSTSSAPPAGDVRLNGQDTQDSLAHAAQAATAAAIAAAVSAAQAAGVPSITILRGANGAEGPPTVSFSSDGAVTTMGEVNLNFDDHHQDVAVEVEIESSDASGEGRNDPEPNIRDNSAESRPDARYEEGPRVDAMVPLLQDLETLHTDLQPFLVRCRDLLSTDTSFDDNSAPSYQEAVRVFGGVSETMHSLAHACHSLSDLMVDFYEDAPRSLRCRPVVLQHSTILEAGIPIRLQQQDFEAPINVRRMDVGGASPSGSDMSIDPNAANDSSSQQRPPPSASAPPTASSTDTQSSPDPQGGFASVQVGRFHMNGPDGLPGDLEIFMDFGLGPDHGPMGTFMDNPTTEATAPNARVNEGATATTGSGGTVTGGTPANGAREWGLPLPGFSIIPGASGTFVHAPGPGQLNNLHSSLQAIAGQLRNQLMNAVSPDAIPRASPAPGASARPAPPTGEGASESLSQGAQGTSTSADTTPPPTSTPSGATAPVATSSAPAGTATDSSTSTTQTTLPPRRTGAGAVPPPPVVDMIHSLFQGAFDPALPCNSHHIRGTRLRGSPTQRMRIDMFPTTVAAAPAQPQILRRSAMMAAAPGGRLVAVAVPASSATHQPPPPPSADAPQRPDGGFHAADGDFLLSFLSGPPFSLQNMPGRDGAEQNLPPNPSAADFLNNLVGAPHIEGQSTVSDLLMTMARNLTWSDVVDLMGAQEVVTETILVRLRPVLQEFAAQRLLQGEEPSLETINRACDRLFAEMRPYIDAMQTTRLRESVDLSATINNYLHAQLPGIINLIVNPDPGVSFGPRLIHRLKVYARQLIAIIMHCCADGDQGFDSIVRNCVRHLTRGVPEALQQWTEFQSVNNLHYYTAGLNVPLEDIQSYLVYRIPNTVPVTAPAPLELMETDGALLTSEKPEEGATALVSMDTENLPEVILGSEPWHNSLPAEWVPVIARDSQRQRRQSSQKPFSDAYLTGMPPKRRKIIAAAKPPGETLSQTISDGVRQAIQAAGVSSPMAERAIAEAGRDPSLQQAYKEQEKAVVTPGLRDDPDLKACPQRFPNARKFFNK